MIVPSASKVSSAVSTRRAPADSLSLQIGRQAMRIPASPQRRGAKIGRRQTQRVRIARIARPSPPARAVSITVRVIGGCATGCQTRPGSDRAAPDQRLLELRHSCSTRPECARPAAIGADADRDQPRGDRGRGPLLDPPQVRDNLMAGGAPEQRASVKHGGQIPGGVLPTRIAPAALPRHRRRIRCRHVAMSATEPNVVHPGD